MPDMPEYKHNGWVALGAALLAIGGAWIVGWAIAVLAGNSEEKWKAFWIWPSQASVVLVFLGFLIVIGVIFDWGLPGTRRPPLAVDGGPMGLPREGRGVFAQAGNLLVRLLAPSRVPEIVVSEQPMPVQQTAQQIDVDGQLRDEMAKVLRAYAARAMIVLTHTDGEPYNAYRRARWELEKIADIAVGTEHSHLVQAQMEIEQGEGKVRMGTPAKNVRREIRKITRDAIVKIHAMAEVGTEHDRTYYIDRMKALLRERFDLGAELIVFDEPWVFDKPTDLEPRLAEWRRRTSYLLSDAYPGGPYGRFYGHGGDYRGCLRELGRIIEEVPVLRVSHLFRFEAYEKPVSGQA